jgi:hypothetical protein
MSLEHLISLSSLPRHETASHPLVLFVMLFAIVRIPGLGFRNHRSRDAGDARPIPLTLATLSIGLYLALVCWYLTQEQYADPAEPTLAAIGWLFRAGQPIYHALDSPERYSHIYGPMAFIIPSWSLDLFGPGIRASKIPGALSALFGLALVFGMVSRIAGRRQALILTGVLAGLCLMFQHYTFWIRPDSLQFLSAAAALLAAVATTGAIIPGLVLGAATGMLIGLKITGGLYAVPAFALLAAKRRYRTIIVGAVVTCVVAAAPFMLDDHVSFSNYMRWIRISAGNGIELRALRANVEWALFLLMPLLPAARRASAGAEERVLGWSLVGSMLVVVCAASKPGAGPYHLIPFLPVVIYGKALVRQRDPARGRADANHDAGVAAFLCSIVIVACLQTSYFVWSASRIPGAPVVDDIKRFAERHPSARIEMGYSDVNEALTFVRPVLVFRQGSYLLDAPAIQEYQMSGLELPGATLRAIEECRVNIWLIAKGGQPFLIRNRYPSTGYVPIFDARFRLAFLKAYRRTSSTQFFDVWECAIMDAADRRQRTSGSE